MQYIAFTGHRPQDLPRGATYAAFAAALDLQISPLDTTFICGGALGVDTWAAEYAISRGIPFILALPFQISDMTKFWPQQARATLALHWLRASQVHVVHPNGYDVRAYQERNAWMVDHADVVMAVWTGKTSGGTANCIAYAKRCSKPVYNLLRPNGGFDGKVASI